MRLPRYPIYVPSKGRADRCLTARFLNDDGVPFRLVVEEQEHDAYAARFGEDRLLVLPFQDRGSVIPARNWIKDHATEEGHERHWQLDDNINDVWRVYRGERLHCKSGPALAASEDFVDRYENVALAGLNYVMFGLHVTKPFILNCRVYSCTLVLNSLPYRWRGRYNEDTDYCLQVLAGGWCTILINAFLVQKIASMNMKGGNTTELYESGDGRLKMARSLERRWPGVVEVKRRWGRPQHVVHSAWQKFDTPLKRRPDVEVGTGPDEYGMTLRQVAPEIRSAEMRELVADHRRLVEDLADDDE